ncbi:vWA domain-containing protein [Butyrivibrio sp. TB]|uniref:vWA domain-containing protein n=1 Tax=Butyrivibrio sp. TB TaxID=1520809 RepID=UPI0008B7B756|nr:von Willebrand factor type A domain-containing protein [Butyrivibrio sp. TB]SEQ41783.1 Ca-activated chloride channel family protein [Butyrivibrio sp. TB]
MKKTFVKALTLTTSLTILAGCSSSVQVETTNDQATDQTYNTMSPCIIEDPASDYKCVEAPSNYCVDNECTDTSGCETDSYAYEEPDMNTEEYTQQVENGFTNVSDNALSTFGADVDTASYTNFRRLVNSGYTIDTIPEGSIRVEEMLNYFDYDNLNTNAVNISSDVQEAFSVTYETGTCPWNTENGLLVMNVKANQTQVDNAGTNFVFLIDTSGSMSSPEEERIGLVVQSFNAFLETLSGNYTISVVTYSGSSETLIEGSSDKGQIKEALTAAYNSCVQYGGGTNGSGGITAAYEIANKYFIEGGNNRVIIASDGDMNLGLTSATELTDLITSEKESGVFLTVLGFGAGNYSDANMEAIADAGNGNYFYIDCLGEAKRVLCDKISESTVTVAKDVKFQVEFNPNQISSYRLVGYENRTMAAQDFEDDTKDGGEVGAGQDVTVVYELVYADGEGSDSDLRYQNGVQTTTEADSDEILALSIRYKKPEGKNSDNEKSVELNYVITPSEGDNSASFTFAAAVVESSLIISSSAYKENANLENATARAQNSAGDDPYKTEFVALLKQLHQ